MQADQVDIGMCSYLVSGLKWHDCKIAAFVCINLYPKFVIFAGHCIECSNISMLSILHL